MKGFSNQEVKAKVQYLFYTCTSSSSNILPPPKATVDADAIGISTAMSMFSLLSLFVKHIFTV